MKIRLSNSIRRRWESPASIYEAMKMQAQRQRNRLSTPIWAAAALAAVVLAAIPAAARNADWTLGAIKRPTMLLATVQVRGESFDIESSEEVTSANLLLHDPVAFSVPLTISGQSFDSVKSLWVAEAQIPADAPIELYNLEINGGADESVHAVKVIDAVPEEWTWIHVTDIHLGYASAPQIIIDAMNDINLIDPEFIVNTGDTLSYGGENYLGSEEQTYPFYLPLWESAVKVPTMTVAGNHDMNHIRCCLTCKSAGSCTKPALQDLYREHVGPLYFSFDFGAVHFVGLDLSGYPTCCPGYNVDDELDAWAREDLAGMPGDARILFAHQYNSDDVKLQSLFQDFGVGLFFVGHNHIDNLSSYGSTQIVRTTSLWSEDEDQKRRFRLIHMNGSSVASLGYDGSQTNSVQAGNKITAMYSPSNDGTAQEITASVRNDLLEPFDDLLLKFVMPTARAGQGYETSGGVNFQTIVGEEKTAVYMHVSVAAEGSATATVSMYGEPEPAANVAAADAEDDQGGAIVVSWDLSPEDGAGRDIVAGYEIFRSESPDGEFELVGSVEKGVSEFTDDQTTDRVGCYYIVRATDGALYADTEAVGPAESADNIAPAAPEFIRIALGDDWLELEWEANTEPDLAGYRVDFESSPGLWQKSDLINATATSLLENNIEFGRAYTYRMAALDAYGNESDPSNELTQTLYMPGDASGDGIVNIVDALPIMYLFGLSEGDEGFLPRIDSNRDLTISADDFLYIAYNYNLNTETYNPRFAREAANGGHAKHLQTYKTLRNAASGMKDGPDRNEALALLDGYIKLAEQGDEGSVRLKLAKGWNLVALPFDAERLQIDVALNAAEISSNEASVFRHAKAGDGEKYVSVEKPEELISAGEGFWLYAPEAVELDVFGVARLEGSIDVMLTIGWNLIGNGTNAAVYLSGNKLTAASESGSYGPAIAELMEENKIAFYAYGGERYEKLSSEDFLSPNAGCWVYSTQNITLHFDSP